MGLFLVDPAKTSDKYKNSAFNGCFRFSSPEYLLNGRLRPYGRNGEGIMTQYGQCEPSLNARLVLPGELELGV